MTPGERVTTEEDGLIEAISPERFRPFLDECRGDRVRALRLYAWDSEAARALQSPLRDLEVSLRNRIHGRLETRGGRADRWDVPRTRPNDQGRQMVGRARATLAARRPYRPFGPCDIVAQLSFGFWWARSAGEAVVATTR